MAEVEHDIDVIEQALGVLIRQTRSARFSDAVRTRAGIHLDRAGYALLLAIARTQPVRLSDLANELSVDVSTASRQVATLEQRGLVDRQPDPDDGRAVRLSLSASGRELTAGLRDAWRATIADVLVQWHPDEIARFAPLIERFADDLAAYEAE